MSMHDLSAHDAVERMAALARRALERYDVAPDATLKLLNVSENATYLIDDAASDRRMVLRVHRRGYHGNAQIESELAWLDALRTDAGVRTPRVICDRTGRRLLAVDEDGAVEPRHVVMFEWLPGIEPPGERLVQSFEELGEITARMHEHARSWRRPAGFDRFAWDYDGAFGDTARWGRWQHGVAVGPPEREILGRLDETLRRRLRDFGQGPERYGLVHADLRLANLLVDGHGDGDSHGDGNGHGHGMQTAVIDFDDCGWSWLLYDLGAALSFIEDDPCVPELVDAWVRGYRRVRSLSEADVAEIPTFLMMRRLLLVAWIGSHSGTDLARSMGAQYTLGSCNLAEHYLTRFG
jgi:Ser/Thr protein kinase RdoA (MazF antagonist)